MKLIPNALRRVRPNGRQYQTLGDAARDQKDWKAAAAAYRRFLDHNPADFAIWVQYGHSLKEYGDPVGAEQAYRTGLVLRPHDVDAQVHLAHLLKNLGRVADAAGLFAEIFCSIRSRRSFQDLADALGTDDVPITAALRTACSVAGHAVFLEIDDLLSFLENHRTVSGIQRVQIGIIEGILRDTAPSGATYLFVLNDAASGPLWSVRTEELQRLVTYLHAPVVERDTLSKIIADTWSNAVAVIPSRGQVYFNAGSFWGDDLTIQRYADLKRNGVLLGAYIHDIIPVSHPEFAEAGLVWRFKLSLGDGLALFDFMLAVSQFTRQEVERLQSFHRLPMTPISVVPLAHASAGKGGEGWGGRIAFLRGRRYALMVATIEGRKNHALLLTAWKQFLAEGLDPPDLVFAGRKGWRATAFYEALEASHALNGRVHLLHGLSDADIATLYDNCQFTVFPSFVEGWGLPVGESLAHGQPCVASGTSAIPEVGGDLVDYLDPLNARGGIDVLRRMAFDGQHRDTRAAEIRRGFQPRTWLGVTAGVLAAIDGLRQQEALQPRPAEPLLASGEVFWAKRLASGDVPDDYPAHPHRLMLRGRWVAHDGLGFGFAGRHGRLAFRSDLPAGTAIETYVQLHVTGAMEGAPQQLAIWIGPHQGSSPVVHDQPWTGQVGPGFRSCIHLSGTVGADQLVGIHLRLGGDDPPEAGRPDGTRFTVTVGAIGYAPHADSSARLCLTEALLRGPGASTGTAALLRGGQGGQHSAP